MEEGFIYFNQHLKALPSRRGGPAVRQKNKLVELAAPDPNLTLAASPGMSFGPVSKILGLPSSSIHPDLQHLPLKDLVRLRLEKRRNPTYDSLEEFFKIRNSCHILEEINNDFFCDCARGIAGHLCKHTMAITYDRTDFPVDRRLNAVKFKRRPKGRPQGIGLAAARTRDQGLQDFYKISPRFHQDFTKISPRFHQDFTKISPRFLKQNSQLGEVSYLF